jgi:hypothetical protein
MKVMVAKVAFPAVAHRDEVVLHKISAVRITSTFQEFTSRAEIELPRKVKYFDRHKVGDVFRTGDPVVISLGYDGILQEEYRGYVTSASADIPIVIRCQDEMWKVKRLPVNFSAASTTLEKLLKTICPGYQIDALENVPLGGIRLSQTTVGAVLEKLKQDFGLYSYMNGKELVCGKYYSKNTSRPVVKFDLERNIASNALTYRNKEDILLKVTGTSILKKGRQLKYVFGEDGGETLSRPYYNVSTQADLEKLVKLDYEKIRQDGFDGSITAFGEPHVKHGEKAQIVSSTYPDRNGLYFIEGTEKTLDQSGIRQEIKLGDKAG